MSNENLRDMAGKAITNTYKGILRIANNIDLENTSKDYFNSEIYYSLNWSGEGDNNTKNYFDNESNIRRFRTNDKYTNLKLPVTDSSGNYMGFSLGTDSVLVGPGIFKDNESLKNNFTAIDIPSNIIFVGKENKKTPSEKSDKGGDIIIEGNGATICFESDEHIGEIKNDVIKKENIFKTLFSINREPTQYDAFIFHQNNIEKYNDGSYGCKIELENLQEYVNKEINEYFTSNICGLPTGTIVSQYCSLKKWFCWSENSSNDTDIEWMGFRPSMYTSNQSMYSYFNVLQNAALLKNTLLYYNGSNSNTVVNETAPDFKKGYALCNGGRIDIDLRPSYLQGITNEKLSFDLFFDLFYTIGYYYHTNKDGLYFHNVKFNKENNKYELEHIKSEDGSLDSEILYGMAMAAMLVFKALDKRFSLNDNVYPDGTIEERVEEVQNYLRSLTFPDEYVFNIVEKDPNKSSFYYKYKGRLDKDTTENILINIGIPIDSYESLMPYYYVEDEKIIKKYTELCKLPVIEYMIKLFLEREEIGWSNFVYQFYLPKLFTITDAEVNDAGTYKGLYGAHLGLAVGQFIGSSGVSLCESYTDNSGNRIEPPSQLYQPFNCYFNLNTSVLAHSHGIAKSPATITKGELLSNFKKSDTKGLLKPIRGGAGDNTISEKDSVDIIPAACFRGNYVAYRDHLSKDNMDSYVLQEITIYDNVKKKRCEFGDLAEIVYDKNTMTVGYQVNNLVDGPSFKWYGKTSEPLWAKNTSLTSFTKKFNQPDNIGYFCPESVNTLPLIKL